MGGQSSPWAELTLRVIRSRSGESTLAQAEGMDVVPVLRTIRSAAPQNVEDGQRIEIARMQQLLAERD